MYNHSWTMQMRLYTDNIGLDAMQVQEIKRTRAQSHHNERIAS